MHLLTSTLKNICWDSMHFYFFRLYDCCFTHCRVDLTHYCNCIHSWLWFRTVSMSVTLVLCFLFMFATTGEYKHCTKSGIFRLVLYGFPRYCMFINIHIPIQIILNKWMKWSHSVVMYRMWLDIVSLETGTSQENESIWWQHMLFQNLYIPFSFNSASIDVQVFHAMDLLFPLSKVFGMCYRCQSQNE